MNWTKPTAAIVLASMFFACGPPSRDRAVQTTAKKTCDRFDQCGELEENYSSYNECLTEWEDNYYDGWSADECEDDINPDQLDECHATIDNFDCDSGGLGVLAILAGSCSQAQVCD